MAGQAGGGEAPHLVRRIRAAAVVVVVAGVAVVAVVGVFAVVQSTLAVGG